MAVNAYQPGQPPSLADNEGLISTHSDVYFQIHNSSHSNEIFKAIKHQGTLQLTSRRMIWQNSDKHHKLRDFSVTFGSIQKFQLQQPLFGANYIQGEATGEPGIFGFQGKISWYLTFYSMNIPSKSNYFFASLCRSNKST